MVSMFAAVQSAATGLVVPFASTTGTAPKPLMLIVIAPGVQLVPGVHVRIAFVYVVRIGARDPTYAVGLLLVTVIVVAVAACRDDLVGMTAGSVPLLILIA